MLAMQKSFPRMRTDTAGNMRISVIGTSGSGKTTLAGNLAAALGATHLDLDAINWQPNWCDLSKNEPEEFRRRVTLAVQTDAWAACGNYSAVRPIVLARATHIVWLDYSKPLVMRRVIQRSFARAIRKQELWPGTGNRETFARWFDEGHPIRWAWDTYDRRRERARAEFEDPALGHIERIRLSHPRQAQPLIVRLAGGE